jgi:hypothetical protein
MGVMRYKAAEERRGRESVARSGSSSTPLRSTGVAGGSNVSTGVEALRYSL